MKKTRSTEEQIAYALRQVELGTPVAEVVRKMGISEQTFYRRKKQYTRMSLGQIRRLQQLEEENRKLKQLVAELSLANLTLKRRPLKGYTTGSGTDVRCPSGSVALAHVYFRWRDKGRSTESTTISNRFQYNLGRASNPPEGELGSEL